MEHYIQLLFPDKSGTNLLYCRGRSGVGAVSCSRNFHMANPRSIAAVIYLHIMKLKSFGITNTTKMFHIRKIDTEKLFFQIDYIQAFSTGIYKSSSP